MSDVKYCFVRPEVGLDTPICQYLDLDYLLRLLTTNKYFVRVKTASLIKTKNFRLLRICFPYIPPTVSLTNPYWSEIWRLLRINLHYVRSEDICPHHAGHSVIKKAI